MATTAQQVFKLPGAEAITAVILRPTDPSQDDAEVTVALSDADVSTLPGETPPSLPFAKVLARDSGLELTEALTKEGQLTGDSEFAGGKIVVEATEAQRILWPTLDWNDKAVEVYLGAKLAADGSQMPFASYDTFFTGKVDEIRALGQGRMEITFVDVRVDYEKRFRRKVYRGYGGAYHIRPNAHLTSNGNAAVQWGRPWTIEIVGHLRALPSLSGQFYKIGTDPSFTLILRNDGRVEVRFKRGIVLVSAVAEYVPSVGRPFYFAVTDDVFGNWELYCGEDSDDVLLQQSGTEHTTSNDQNLTELAIGEAGGPEFDVWEMRLWDVVKTKEELEDLGDGPVTDAATRANLIESWRFSEGAELGAGPEIVFGEKSLIDFEPAGAGTPAWVSSYEADDPDLFAGSPVGQGKPAAFGEPRNIPLVQIDVQRGLHAWDDQLGGGLNRMRANGVPMVPELSVSAVSAGDVDFVASTNSIVIQDPAVGDFSRLVAGQAAPARLGQRIEVLNAAQAANQGIFRVAVDGVAEDGSSVKVADRALVDETGPSDLVVRSYPADVQYAVEATRPVVALPSAPDGELTADPVGRLPGSGVARWSELVELMTGITPDTTAVSFDPVLAFYLELGSAITTAQILNTMARSAYGWWIEKPNGGLRLGNFAPPTGGGFSVDESVLSEVEPLRSPKPSWRFAVGHSKVWKIQDGDSLASSVSFADRKDWGSEYTYAPHTDRTVLRKYPNATEHANFDTWLVESDDVATFIALASTMLGTKRWWYDLKFPSLWALDVALHDELTVTWRDQALQLADTPCRVVSRQISTSDYSMSLGVHT